MTIHTASEDSPFEFVRANQVEDIFVRIIDGAVGWWVYDEDTAAPGARAGAGTRVTPGDAFIVEPRENISEFLTAVGADMTLDVTKLGTKGSPKEIRRIRPQPGQEGGLREINRVQDTTPGADTDIFSSDLTFPDTGTALVKVALDGASILEIQEAIGGTTEAYDALNGTSIPAGEGRDFSLTVRDDASYNFHVESNVTVSLLQIDYTRRAVF